MKKQLVNLLIFLFFVQFLNAQSFKINSPSGRVQGIIQKDPSGHLSYSIRKNGKTILLPSRIGILVNDIDLGENVFIGKPKRHSYTETYPIKGVHSVAHNTYNELVFPISVLKDGSSWELEFRVFDDAVAYRYTIPGKGKRTINGESSVWNLPDGCTLWYQSNNKRDYEAPFRVLKTDTVSHLISLMTTSTFMLPKDLGYLKITEANLVNYSDMALETSNGKLYKTLFHNSPSGWETTNEIQSPWRVIITVSSLNQLVNTDVLTNLCPAPSSELAVAEWIKPGRSTWHWMVTGRPKLEDQKQWIDWTKQVGFEYYIIDDGWIRWTKDSLDQWACMKEVVDYATSQGVKIWAWTHSKELVTPQQRADYFAKAKRIGIVGLKIDFMKPADLFWVNWYDDCLRDAAKSELMVNFHGALKPTGRERTWPNELTREGIRGREAGKQPAFHDITLIFTRFVQGHADYTPTDFRPDKLKGSTFAHELAMSVTFTSPLFCFSGRPEDYINSEAAEFLKQLPSTWDETLVLPVSQIGEMAVIARRKGNDWYIGILNSSERNITLDFSFLKSGSFSMESFSDAIENNASWSHQQTTVTSTEKRTIHLLKDGGFVAKLCPK